MHWHTAWGQWAVQLLQCAGLPAGGTGSPAHRRSLPKERLRGTAAPKVLAHQLGVRGILPRRRSLPRERLRGMAAPNGAGPPARGIGCLAHEVVAA